MNARMWFLFRRSVITFGYANYVNKAETTAQTEKGDSLIMNVYQEYLFNDDEKRAKKDFKIRLVYNGVNYYAPFYGKELADLIIEGDPVMLQIQKTYQDVKNIVSHLPKNTRINGAMQQISMHMQASALIVGTVRFQSGVGDTSPVSQLPFPVNTGVLKEPVVHKRKSTTTTTAAQGTSSQPSSQPATTGPTAAKVAKVSLSSLIGSDRTDIGLMANQCHCGEAVCRWRGFKKAYQGCAQKWLLGMLRRLGVGWHGTESWCPQCVQRQIRSLEAFPNAAPRLLPALLFC